MYDAERIRSKLNHRANYTFSEIKCSIFPECSLEGRDKPSAILNHLETRLEERYKKKENVSLEVKP